MDNPTRLISEEASARPIRAPGVILFALIAVLFGIGWVWEGWRLLSPERLPALLQERLADKATYIGWTALGTGAACLGVAVGLFFRFQWALYAVVGMAGFWLLVGIVVAGGSVYTLISNWGTYSKAGFILLIIPPTVAIGLPLSYLVYFLRKPIRQFFDHGSRRPRTRPLGLTLIAWWHILTGGMVVFAFRIFDGPLFQFFGLLLRGLPALIIQLALSGWSIALGIGLLRGRHWGWVAAVIFVIFSGVNMGSTGFFMNSEAFQAGLPASLEPPSPEQIRLASWAISGIGILSSMILLWLLMRYRRYFHAETEPQTVE